jgi:DNA-binding Lrp family transcriptional regulator
MDETDVKILGKLLSDARLSYRRIADEISVSPPTVLARVKKLESDSVSIVMKANEEPLQVI